VVDFKRVVGFVENDYYGAFVVDIFFLEKRVAENFGLRNAGLDL